MPVSVAAKRALDIAVAAVAAAAALPVMVVTAFTILLTMGRPVLFRQRRIGQYARPFDLIKFRTMRQCIAADGPSTDAARLTKTGIWLRKTSLDELPQLWNVLKGDMSLVGPRPLLPEYLPRYTPEQRRRHEVKPGITGWAQVNGRNSLSWEERFELDIWYVANRSFALDLRILWMTAMAVFKRSNISANGHATMPEFLGTSTSRQPS